MNNIRYHRMKNDLTLEELGKKIGTSKQYLSEIEIGKRQPSDKMKLKLSIALDVPIDELTGETDV